MSKISLLISQLDFAQKLLSIQIELERSRISNEFFLHLLEVYQKVSLAEKNMQVKNACSHISSTNV